MISTGEHWKERLTAPSYRVAEAARYAGTSAQTVNNWQKLGENESSAIGQRDSGKPLSYLQLIELGVVAAMRKEGVPLRAIRETRKYLARQLVSKFPFAEYRFKTDGKQLLMDSETFDPSVSGKLVVVSENGQYAWKEILVRLLRQFDYSPDKDRIVVRWHVGGEQSPIIIDPRICFGNPNVGGIPTWTLRERWKVGEGLSDLADDYDLDPALVSQALRFEGIDPNRPPKWKH
jgi:uncharacterized protein (DUF433 family)